MKPISEVAREFILLRVENVRGLDLDVFDFDYDLTWAALFLNADGKVYGRYGSRHPDSVTKHRTLAGLRHALVSALEAHRREPPAKAPPRREPRTVEQYPALRRIAPKGCVHCHNVYEARRETERAAGTWKVDDVWVYPPPENLGLELDPDAGGTVRAVPAGSAAARLGLRPGDVLARIGETPVASYSDVQYALHRAPARGAVAVRWSRGGEAMAGELELPEGWRKSDLTWRWSLRSLPPDPSVRGDDLTAAERKALGLGARQLAFRQGPFVSKAARQAGVQTNDVIVGIDGRSPEMTARQFDVHMRLNYRSGDRVTLKLLRDGKPLDVTLDLP